MPSLGPLPRRALPAAPLIPEETREAARLIIVGEGTGPSPTPAPRSPIVSISDIPSPDEAESERAR